MYKCPKCGHWMQWRYQYGQAYWICNQCGYYPQVTYDNKTEVVNRDSQRTDTGTRLDK